MSFVPPQPSVYTALKIRGHPFLAQPVSDAPVVEHDEATSGRLDGSGSEEQQLQWRHHRHLFARHGARPNLQQEHEC